MQQWWAFIKSDSALNVAPPGLIDNSKLEAAIINGVTSLKVKDYYSLNKEQWYYLFDIYGGGPTICKKKDYSAPPAQN